MNIKLCLNVKMLKYLSDRQGISLFLSIIILAILLAISLGMSTILLSQMRMISGIGNSVIAFYAADTGAEKVLYEDKRCRADCPPPCPPPCTPPPPCPPPPVPCRAPGEPCPCPDYCQGYPDACQGLPDGYSIGQTLENASTYDAKFFTNGTITIRSIGKYQEVRRAIEVTR